MYLDYDITPGTNTWEVFDAPSGVVVFTQIPFAWLAHFLCWLFTDRTPYV